MTEDDETLLRRAIALADTARDTGNPPFGSLLVDAHGTVLVEAHNTTLTEGDITAHPELKLARWAARELAATAAATTTMYTSCQPCGMCMGAIERSGLGRIVYALGTDQFISLVSPPDRPTLHLDGPALFDEARLPIDAYYDH